MYKYLAVVAVVSLIANAQEIARCGPCFGNKACPWNDDGLGRINFCTKFGFCGSTDAFKAQQDAGDYICSRTLDGSIDQQDVCRNQPNPNEWCNQNILNGSTCSLNDGRCEIKNVDATKFIGYHAGTNAPAGGATTTTGITTTTTDTVPIIATAPAPAPASDSTSSQSSSALSSMILPSIAMAILLAAGIMVL